MECDNKPNLRLLIVDKDPQVIRGFEQSAAELAKDWELEFAHSGDEALSLLSKAPVDVIITELRIPDMDGNELLEVASQHYPSVMRIILSGNKDEMAVLKSTRLAHQFFAKPCHYKTLWRAIDRSCRLRNTLQNPQLIEIITGINRLPSLPNLYVRLVKKLQYENTTLKDIGDLITEDVTMTAKLLQLVNSAFFGVSGKVTSPNRAVSLLGLNTIKALVLVIQLFEEFQDYASPSFSLKGLWRHSIAVGTISKEMAAQAGLNSAAQDDAQLAGVLHDIGKLIQVRIHGFFRQVKLVRGRVTLESEFESYHTSHAEMGAYLLNLWALPEVVVEAVAFHHQPDSVSSDRFELFSIVNIANGLDILLNMYEPEEHMESYMDIDHIKRLGMQNNLSEWLLIAKRICQMETGE